ncbi:hypothetical protein GALMADRAFT_229964 [Galerina marginata CBS 339.88]|uniref:Uncharacterized protein n=1 Tax=Galerina marginata (strain CBS 339.88) TaxID=685588 RepID=A0A067SI30_GALM3|nr:hypothetical protein GALMADRAFT_229964 [Galerina marginata CBS 339.88]
MPKAAPSTKKAKATCKAPVPRKAQPKAADVQSFAGWHLQVEWDSPRTNCLLDWLDQNPDDHNRLFSNSTVAAKEEKRRKVVFDCDKEDVEMRTWYLKEPAKFSSSLSNYLNCLHTKYREFNQQLGQTGAGLSYDEIDPGSNIYNLIDELSVEFPYWERLHGYWRTLPNYNPLTVTLEPDQDLEGGALNLFQRGDSQPPAGSLLGLGLEGEPPAHPAFTDNNSLTPTPEEQAEIEADPDAEGEDEDMADTVPRTTPPRPATAMRSTFGASKGGNGAVTSKIAQSTIKKFSPPSRSSASRSAGAKQNPLVALALDSENDARLAAKLHDKKLDHDMGNIDVSKVKIALLSQREAGEIEQKHNEHQLALQREAAENDRQRKDNEVQILKLRLQLQQGQPAQQVGGEFAQQ